MKLSTKAVSLLVVVALLVTGSIGAFAAPKFPSKPVTLLVPWAAGGGTDTVARTLVRDADKFLGVGVNVVNQTGGSGAVGHVAGATTRPDGYTVTMVTFELLTIPVMGLAPVKYTDFKPLMRLNSDAAAITVKADAPWKNLAEFLADARANPKKINVGVSGLGGVWHLAAGLLEDEANVSLNIVPHEGAAPAITNLLGGHIDAVAVSPAEVAPHVKSGALRILGIMSEARDPNFPNVPTLKEQGLNLVFGTWRGLAVPKATPDEVVATLSSAFKKMFDEPAFKEALAKGGFGVAYLDGKDFTAYLAQQSRVVERVMKKLGLAK